MSFYLKNRKEIFIFISILLVLLFFPSLHPVHGGLLGDIANGVKGIWHGITGAVSDALKSVANAIVSGLVTLIFLILGAIGTALMNFAEGIFNWVTSPDFINWGSSCSIGTHPCTTYVYNPVVNTGWTLIRDFTNMLFIMGLVIIGLATIIGYKDYAAKKTLPLLIGVALLINFTPIVCGIIIDASNVVMNFFLDHGGRLVSHGWMSTFSSQFGEVVKGKWLSSDLSGLGERIGKALMYLTFDYISALIFILYAFLFLVRYVVLWLLIIISPLAFFAYIFPGSRNFFHQWWHHFVQWSIIGIIPAFLLFLANVFTNTASTNGNAELAAAGFMTATLIYLVPTILLLIGLYFALNTSAVGASMITGGFQKHVIGRVRKGYELAKRGTKRKIKESRPVSWARDKFGWAAKRIPGLGAEYEATRRERRRKDIQKAEGVISTFNTASDRERAARQFGVAGSIALAQYKLKHGEELTSKDIEYLKKGLKYQSVSARDLKKARPDLAYLIEEAEGIPEVKKKAKEEAKERLIPERIKTDYESVQKEIKELNEKLKEIPRGSPEEENIMQKITRLNLEKSTLEKMADFYRKTPSAKEIVNTYNERISQLETKKRALDEEIRRHPEKEEEIMRKIQKVNTDIAALETARDKKEVLYKPEKEKVKTKTQEALKEMIKLKRIESTEKAIRSLSPKEISENLRPEAINAETIAFLSPKQIESIAKNSPEEIKESIRNVIKNLKGEVDKIKGEKESSSLPELQKKLEDVGINFLVNVGHIVKNENFNIPEETKEQLRKYIKDTKENTE